MSTYFPKMEIVPSDWISQAEAARIRGVSRQAIAKLVKSGRLKTIQIGGRTFVSRTDVEGFTPHDAGRRKKKDQDDRN